MSEFDIAVVDEVTPISVLPPELQARIKARAEEIKAGCSVSVRRIPNRAKGFVSPDGMEISSFMGVIVAVLHANIHYKSMFKRGEINPVDCYAYGTKENKNLAPAPDVKERYATNCGTACKKFQWGSGPGGSGKECAEHTCLAVYVPAFGDDLYVVDMKKSNSRIADNYLVSVTNKYGNPIAVFTKFEMGLKRDWSATLTAVSNIDADLVANLANRMDEAHNILVERVRSAYNVSNAASDNLDDPNQP